MSDQPASIPSEPIIDLPDIPLPTIRTDTGIKDVFKTSVAFKFAFVGSGHAGCRLAESFYQLGYRRVAAINTALQDLDSLVIPPEYRMELTTGGAGKNMELAAKYFAQRREDVYDFLARRFGDNIDRLIICVGGGGGTGGGSAVPLVELATELMESFQSQMARELTPPRVGVICTLPTIGDGAQCNANAYRLVHSLFDLLKANKISPLILVDNSRIKTIYPGLAEQVFWDTANQSITSLFHLFNVLASQPTRHTVFDAKDCDSVLSGGLTAFGAMPVKPANGEKFDKTDISYAVRDNLSRNVIVDGLDIRTAQRAACLVVGDSATLASVPHENIEHGFEMLTRIMRAGNTVHRGVYAGSKQGLAIYTMLSGLSGPVARLKELAMRGGIQMGDWDLGV